MKIQRGPDTWFRFEEIAHCQLRPVSSVNPQPERLPGCTRFLVPFPPNSNACATWFVPDDYADWFEASWPSVRRHSSPAAS